MTKSPKKLTFLGTLDSLDTYLSLLHGLGCLKGATNRRRSTSNLDSCTYCQPGRSRVLIRSSGVHDGEIITPLPLSWIPPPAAPLRPPPQRSSQKGASTSPEKKLKTLRTPQTTIREYPFFGSGKWWLGRTARSTKSHARFRQGKGALRG